tara:strand:+ start:204 stop:869 length:666 start_codon:yes stop_codon:yes gene_type:complete
MKKEFKFIQKIHNKTKRDYLPRMINQKVKGMNIAKKFSFDYWDGKRNYGYGGYNFMPGYWKPLAKKLIKEYNLNSKSRILDVGCGKGYLLYEISLLIPGINIIGFDISKYALKHSKKEISKYLFLHNAKNKYPFKKNYFDLTLSLGCLHNLKIQDLFFSLSEIERVSKFSYIMVESYKNNQELFNLQCWALTCESFFSKDSWIWIFDKSKFSGDYEFIYFQ